MGNRAPCPENLNRFANACEMRACIRAVRGLPSTSMSPTDTWIVEFQPNTRYETEIVSEAFVKLWVTQGSYEAPSTQAFLKDWREHTVPLPPPAALGGPRPLNTSLAGLDYELRVYEEIIRPLIDQGLCPNFVRYLGSGHNCTFQQVQGMLAAPRKSTSQGGGGGSNVPPLVRNLLYMLTGMPGRPAIRAARHPPKKRTVTTRDKENIPPANIARFSSPSTLVPTQVAREIKFNLLVNTVIPANSLSLRQWLLQLSPAATAEEPQQPLERGEFAWTSNSEHFQVLFQIMAACVAMDLARLTHNDLHWINVWITPVPSAPVAYLNNNHTYVFDRTLMVRVFDFDRAFAQALGPNRCGDKRAHTPAIDLLKVVERLWAAMATPDRQELIGILTPARRGPARHQPAHPHPLRHVLPNWFQAHTFLRDRHPERLVPSFHLVEKVHNVLEALGERGLRAGYLRGWWGGAGLPPPKENIFVANHTMFDDRGHLLRPHVLSDLRERAVAAVPTHAPPPPKGRTSLAVRLITPTTPSTPRSRSSSSLLPATLTAEATSVADYPSDAQTQRLSRNDASRQATALLTL